MELLVASIVAPLAAPLLLRPFRRMAAVMQAIDGFVLVAICGLVLLHVLPFSLELAGPWVLLTAVAGLLLPSTAERTVLSSSSHAQVHRFIVGLGMLALGLHAMLDGVALASGSHDHHHEGAFMLAVGVVLHRLPLGIAVWWSVRPRWGERRAWTLLGTVIVATIVGYQVGADALPLTVLAHVQAFVAGSLLHVMVHHTSAHLLQDHDSADCAHCDHHHLHVADRADADHDHDHDPEHEHEHEHDHEHDHGHDHAHQHAPPAQSRAAGLGGLIGIAVLVAMTEHDPMFVGMGGGHLDAWATFNTLLRESAPALVLAFVGAGLLRAFLQPSRAAWLKADGRAGQAMRGMAFGLPLPICSCGVLPLYDTLIRAGVPTAAGVAFLVATPELGVDAVLISLPLLGGHLTVARVIAAVVVALFVAIVASRWMADFAGRKSVSHDGGARLRIAERIAAGLRFGLTDLFDDTAPWLLIGLGIAAVLEPLVGQDVFASLPAGVDVVVAAFIGLPGYVCAVGATPIAAVLLHKGLSGGAALAFLLTGPATNVTTFGVLSRLHGRRGALAFAAIMAGAAIGAGLLVNLLLPDAGPIALHDAHGEGATWLETASVAVLGLLALGSLLRQGPRGLIREVIESLGGPHVDASAIDVSARQPG